MGAGAGAPARDRLVRSRGQTDELSSVSEAATQACRSASAPVAGGSAAPGSDSLPPWGSPERLVDW